MSEYTRQDYIDMIKEIDEKGGGLTPWESNFISSFIDNGFPYEFSEKQKDQILRIHWERV